MNKTTFRIATRVTAALFLAAILAPVFITAQEAQAPPPGGKNPPAKMQPCEALGLSPEQEKALATFRKARMDENRAFRDEMQKLRGEMRKLAKDPKAGEAKIDGLIDKTAQLRAERAKTAFRNRAEVEKIFTPEQLEKMIGFRGPGLGRFMGPGFGMRRMGRFGAFPRRPFPGRRS
jgi:Spy/CpxP family protein refolding chaperone